MLCRTHHKLAVAAVQCERGNPLTDLETGHAGADCVYDSGYFVAGYERDRRGVAIFAGEHDEIGRAHTGCAHADAQLA
jgi:hypothetical protein